MVAIVLDASSTVRSKIEDLLQSMGYKGLDIQMYDDAAEALEFFELNEVDLIFSSIEMEGIDGVTFVDLILRKNPNIVSKLFIVTSQINTEHMQDMKDVGAKKFIKKPINDASFNHFITSEIEKALHISSKRF